MTLVAVPGGELDVVDAGSGTPVVCIQTALTDDELRPPADAPALATFRRVLHHRRGYGCSSPAAGPGSTARDAADCIALLTALGIEVRELILEWFPDADDVVIDGADHSLALTHASEIADALEVCLPRHPIDGA